MRLSLYKDLSLQIIYQPRKGWPNHRTLRPLLFSNSGVGLQIKRPPNHEKPTGDSQLTCQAHLAAGCHFAVYPDQTVLL